MAMRVDGPSIQANVAADNAIAQDQEGKEQPESLKLQTPAEKLAQQKKAATEAAEKHEQSVAPGFGQGITALVGKDALSPANDTHNLLLALAGATVAAPSADAANQQTGLTTLATLLPFMGKPQPGVLREAFEPAWANQLADNALPFSGEQQAALVGLQGLFDKLETGFAKLSDPASPLPPKEKEALQALAKTLGLNLPDAAGATKGPTQSNPRLDKMLMLASIVESSFFSSDKVQATLANVPAGIVDALKTAIDGLETVLPQLYVKNDAPLPLANIEIPTAALAAIQTALAPAMATVEGLGLEVATFIKGGAQAKTELKKAMLLLKSGGDVSGMDPKTVALARKLVGFTPTAPVQSKSGNGPTAQDDSVAQGNSQTSSGAIVANSEYGGGIPGLSGDYSVVDVGMDMGAMEGMDIDGLINWVMMQSARLEEEILRDTIKEMQTALTKKKAQREKISLMRESSAQMDTSMQKEFNVLKSSGQIAKDVTFADYKAWRGVQWGDGMVTQEGKLIYPKSQLSQPSPPVDIPDSLRYGAEGKYPGAGVGPSGVNVEPLDAGTAVQTAQEYGITPNDVQNLWAYFWSQTDEVRAKMGGGDFNKWLTEGDGTNCKAGPGLKPGQAGVPSDTNNAKLDAFVTALGNEGAANDAANEKLLKERAAEKAKKETDAKNADASMDGLGDMSAADLSALVSGKFTNEFLNKPENAELKAALASLEPAGGTIEAKLNKLVNDIAYAALKQEHYKADSGGANNTQAGVIKDLMKKLKTVVDAAGAADPAAGAAMEIYLGKRFGACADELRGVGGAGSGTADPTSRQTFATGGGGSDIIGANREAGYHEDGDPGTYDIRVGVSWVGGAFVDERAIGNTAALLDGFGKSGAKGEGITATQGADKAIADAKSEIKAAAEETKGEKPEGLSDEELGKPAFETGMASRWGQRRTQEEMQGMHDPAKVAEKEKPQVEDPELLGTGQAGDPAMLLNHTGSMEEFEASIDSAKMELDSMSEMGEMMTMRLQGMMDRRQKLMEALSNMMKKASQTQDSIIGNLK